MFMLAIILTRWKLSTLCYFRQILLQIHLLTHCRIVEVALYYTLYLKIWRILDVSFRLSSWNCLLQIIGEHWLEQILFQVCCRLWRLHQSSTGTEILLHSCLQFLSSMSLFEMIHQLLKTRLQFWIFKTYTWIKRILQGAHISNIIGVLAYANYRMLHLYHSETELNLKSFLN